MNSTSAPDGGPARESRWLRLARSLVVVGLGLAATLITGLAVLGYVPVVKAAFEPIFKFGGEVSRVAVGLTLFLVVLLPLLSLFVAARKRWLTWPVLGVSWLAVLSLLVWLAWDDPAIRQPLPMEQFSPVFPGAQESDAVLLRYSKGKPSEEAKAFDDVKWAVPFFGVDPRDTAKWRNFVTTHRKELEADWVTLTPQRRWLDELNGFERIGDLAPSRIDANIIRFNVWRTLSQRVCAQATLQALDGRGDDAVATLLPLIEVSRKLQPSARTLVRFMVAVVVERMAVETAGIVLDAGPISAGSRGRLSAALQGRNAPAGARRIMLMEYATFAPAFNSMKLGDQFVLTHGGRGLVRWPLNFLSAIFLNPNATTNLYGDRVFELAALAEARELGKVSVRSRALVDDSLERGGMKNLGGRLMMAMAVPSFDKLLETYWSVEDECTMLATWLAAKR